MAFQNYPWVLKNSPNTLKGPGSNYWSPLNAVIDKRRNRATLQITEVNGKWVCGEMFTNYWPASLRGHGFGHGTYTFEVETPINNLDKRVVLGMFVYPHQDPNRVIPNPLTTNVHTTDGTNEITMEISKWGIEQGPNSQFVVFPQDAHLKHQFIKQAQSITAPGRTRFTFDWQATFVNFEYSYHDNNGSYIVSWHYHPNNSVERIPVPPVQVHINLWLIPDDTLPVGTPNRPSNNQSVSVVLSDFTYEP